MVPHGRPLTGDPTAIGAGEREVLTLWPVDVSHDVVRGLEGTVRTDIVTVDTLLSHVAVLSLLGDDLVTFEGTLYVSILTVSSLRLQVSTQLLQWPTPATPTLLHTAVDLEARDFLQNRKYR